MEKEKVAEDIFRQVAELETMSARYRLNDEVVWNGIVKRMKRSRRIRLMKIVIIPVAIASFLLIVLFLYLKFTLHL